MNKFEQDELFAALAGYVEAKAANAAAIYPDQRRISEARALAFEGKLRAQLAKLKTETWQR